MATVQAPVLRWRNDRLFYTTMGVFVALTGVIGFARTYYLAPWFDAPAGTPALDGVLHVHAAVFTLWLALNVVQPALIASNNRPAHRKIGYIGAILAVLMVVVGNIAGIAAMHRDIPGFDERSFYVLPFFAINAFALIVALAVYWRHRAETHKRLMLLASTQIIEAAIARLIIATTGGIAPVPLYVFADLIIAAGIGYDLVSRGKVHKVWIVGGGLVIASQVLRIAVMETEPWLNFAGFMASLY
jgi:uncharacterized membrane protein YozB (DUF420 family)